MPVGVAADKLRRRVALSEMHGAAPGRARLGRRVVLLAALLFLLANLALRAQALGGRGGALGVFVAAVLAGTLLCALRTAWIGPALAGFGASLCFYGFHSYRPQSQACELLVSAFGAVLVWRLLRLPVSSAAAGRRAVLPFFLLYAVAATASLLLLPAGVLEHRAYLEADGLVRAALSGYPKDPLYPIVSANRLWLFLVFAAALSAQPDQRELFRRLVRGVACAVILTLVLGLLDFVGIISLVRYNLSQLFFGSDYRRLQSTFGNPSWFACFVSLSLPFVVLEFLEARALWRALLAAAFPLAAAGLFLSGSRASWVAVGVLAAGLVALQLAAKRAGRSFPHPGRLGWAAIAASAAVFALLAAGAYWPALAIVPRGSGRLEGVSREIELRGLGLASPRRVAAEYALELARQKPLLGLGYESYNMHLRAQLELPGSRVAGVTNTAIAGDPNETVFDDSHSTYLQALTGLG